MSVDKKPFGRFSVAKKIRYKKGLRVILEHFANALKANAPDYAAV